MQNVMRTGVGYLIQRHVVRRYCHAMEGVPRIAVVGSGPAGFYTAKQILKVRIKFSSHATSDIVVGKQQKLLASCIYLVIF